MRKISKLLTLILLCLSFSAFSQPKDIVLRGKVIEKDTGAPLEYATLVLKSLSEPSKVSGGITDMNGVFEVAVPAGKYQATVEYIGFEEYKIGQTISI
ncbi:MAG: carboxypeptidase-like regulatory domain-containing protein [Flavobacteriia bacterium]|nr:carboxypeptidase-like regulatory domain-containing protein [Flavobacteriia bacterium]